MTAGIFEDVWHPPRVTWEDPYAEHQIRLSITGSPAQTAVSCTCMGKPNARHTPLAVRDVIEPAEALSVWRAHVAEAEAVASDHTA